MPLSTAFFVVALMSQSATATATPAAKPVDPKDKVTCRRYVETGSLIKGRKECHTRREWDLLAEGAQREGERMTQRISTERGN
jgi:hypothetical protein